MRLARSSLLCLAFCLLLPASAVAATFTATATDAELGGAVHATATLAGGSGPTGSIAFSAYAPSDPTCVSAAVFTANVPVNDNGGYPSGDFIPSAVGTYHWTAEYSGDLDNSPESSTCTATSVVSQATPSLTTTATSAPAGSAIHDDATLSGGASPTGSLVFRAFGPNDPTCANPAVFTNSVAVAGNASYGSGSFSNTQAGSYRWTVSYSGDADNAATSSACNASNETSTVTKSSPTISTTATAGAPLGSPIADTATLSGGSSHTGQIVFRAFGPNDPTCANPEAFISTVSEVQAATASYVSGNFTPAAVGAYRWTAEYSGDANNNPATSACNAVNETSTVGPASPTIASVAASAAIGEPIADTATIAGGSSPTGQIVFRAFGPNDPTCANAAAFTNTVAVNDNGSYGSGSFTGPLLGTYLWTVSYSGDANNNPATSACGAANGTSIVTRIPPALSLSPSDAGIGGAIAAFATFGGGSAHTGQVVFRAYGPEDPGCSGAPAFAANVTVTASNGTYASGQFSPLQAGSYRWTASYSGDANNAAETTACATAISTVAQAATAISTHISASSVAVGDGVRDTATLSSGFKPGGSITFKAFGPGDTSCAAKPVFTDTAAVAANGAYASGRFVPAQPGDYRFTVSYSGDASNKAATAACGAGGEFIRVGKRTPTLLARASMRGKKIVVKATLGAAASPRGQIAFRLFGPGDPRCSGKPAWASRSAVHGAGSFGYVIHPRSGHGLYHYSVAYSGDERNRAVSKGCATRGQSIRVS